MRALLPFSVSEDEPAGARLGDLPDPVPTTGEVLVEVAATALNRADLLQMRGAYPPPPGESEVPGLECAGTVLEMGPATEGSGWSAGDRVMALLAGGGHAEKVSVPVGQLLPVPESWSWGQAAAVPEVGLTAYTNLIHEGDLVRGETVLITAAASGVGTFAVQLARSLGARVLVAGRSPERLEELRPLGAEALVPLDGSLVEAVRQLTAGRGADLVLDLVGGEHLPRALAALAPRGRLVLLGLLDGSRAQLDLGAVLRRRLTLKGSVLRSRTRDEKALLVAGFRREVFPSLESGEIRPILDRVVPFDELPDAYRAMAQGGHLGKIVVRLASKV